MSWLKRWRERRKRRILVVMRLVDMHMVHPDQDEAHFCERCGHPVGIYPSGQAVLRMFPNAEIVCQICHGDKEGGYFSTPLPGVPEEITKSVPRKKP